MSATEAFSDGASEYDATRRRLIPPFDAFYGAVIDVLGLLDRPPRRILDLGAGTGLLAGQIHEAYPDAELDLLDGSAEMLDIARERLPGATFHLQDLRDPLPAGEFDAVVSSLAIHHLEHDDQRNLFARIRRVLPAHGVFVLADHVNGPDARCRLPRMRLRIQVVVVDGDRRLRDNAKVRRASHAGSGYKDRGAGRARLRAHGCRRGGVG